MAAAEGQGDLNLPVASVSRVINDALPANINVSQEARKIISKTASVFVLYTTATAASIASKAGRKTMNANDVLEAIMENDFPQFKEPLEKSLTSFRDAQKKKKETSTAKKSEQASKSSKGSPTSSKKSPKQTSKNPAETESGSEMEEDGDE